MQAYKESSWFLYSDFSSMSRHISCRYLLFYLSVSAILVCGLSRRIPRRASCPSCSQDCPEALTVQLPRYEESDLQPRILRDFSTNQNPLYSRSMQKQISQDVTRDDNYILSDENTMSFGNYRSLPKQESTSGNLFLKNFLTNNKFPESVDRQEIFPRKKFTSKYPIVHVPPRQSFGRSGNSLFGNSRDKYSELPLADRNFQDNAEDKEDPASKMLVVYRADRNVESLRKDSRGDASSSNIVPSQRSFPKIEDTFRLRRQNILDEERRIKEIPRPANQEYGFTYPGTGYYPAKFNVAEIQDYVLPQDTRKPTSNVEFNNWDISEDSLQSSKLGQLMQIEDNVLEMYPTNKQETIIPEEANDQIDYNPYILHQNIWTPTKERESFNNLNFAARKNSQESEMKRLQAVENNWLQKYPAMEQTGHFNDEESRERNYFANEQNMNQEYFEDDTEKDPIMIDRDDYYPYALLQDTSMWRPMQNTEFIDNLDFTHKNLQDADAVQKAEPMEIYPEENNYFQKKENKDMIPNDKAHASADKTIRPTKYPNIFSRYLNIFNKIRHPAETSETQESLKPKNTVLHTNPIENRNKRLLNDETIQDNARTHDLNRPKHIFSIKEYNSPAIETQNAQDDLTKLDSDLLDDIEEPPEKPTEPTPTQSLVELFTSRQ